MSAKERIVALLDTVPDEVLVEVATFIEDQRSKLAGHGDKPPAAPLFKPTPMGGLARGVRITAEGIAAARREMWGISR